MRSRLAASILPLLLAASACRDKSPPPPPTPAGPSPEEAASSAQAAASAVASSLMAQMQTVVTGKVHSEGGALGTWDITLDSCQSGERNGFYGVDFYAPGSDELRLRYVHDEAQGEIVKIVYPTKKDTALQLDRNEKCTVLEGHVEKTNVSTGTAKGQIRHLNGHVKFDCKHTGGKGRVSGEATFAHCH
jgi:hypothetical protein